jgi:predicted RNase H-like nuclease
MSDSATFIGIDLAWSEKKGSGVAVLEGGQQGAQLIDACLISSTEVRAYIRCHTRESTVVAIDAPLIIQNQTGQRPCESLVSKRYANRHAGAYSTNLSLHPDSAGVRLAKDLEEELAFNHAPVVSQRRNSHIMIEVYPHPAIVELFQLPSILKYKKGKAAEKRRGQQELQRRIGELSSFTPPLKVTPKPSDCLAIDTNLLRGAALKANEDKLDAVICAYIAYYYWFWGSDRTQLFGDVKDGYIIVPLLFKDIP